METRRHQSVALPQSVAETPACFDRSLWAEWTGSQLRPVVGPVTGNFGTVGRCNVRLEKGNPTFPLSWWPALWKWCALKPCWSAAVWWHGTTNQQWLWKLHSRFCAALPSVQSLAPWFPNEMPKFLLSEKRVLDYWAKVQFFSLFGPGALIKSSFCQEILKFFPVIF